MPYLNDCGGRFKCPLKDDAGKSVATLLWGDPLTVLQRDDTRTRVLARARKGWIDSSFVGDEADPGLLELYIIDVGQGDGVLMRTPHDNSWHLIDAGVRAQDQMTKKGAANFLRWKFLDELKLPGVQLATAIVTHPDEDHYGGMLDVLGGSAPGRQPYAVSVQQFWHCGMARFAGAPKLGSIRNDTSTTPLDQARSAPRAKGRFITELISGKGHFRRPPRPFAGSAERGFEGLAELVGQVPAKVKRLDHRRRWLPAYAPSGTVGHTSIRVLGPVAESLAGGGQGLRWLGSESETRNGHSVVLRIDHGAARILLTGDLNTASQQLLLACHGAAEFEVDVAKGCHHGSDDVDLNFVRAMAARATVVSSGDNEDYAHPRPRVLGASAHYGREAINTRGELLPPLLYSTELARSVKLAYTQELRTRAQPGPQYDLYALEARFAGSSSTSGPYKRLNWLPMATNLVYGLVNVRTDGRRILMGYMREGSSDFDVQVFMAGQAPQP